MAEYSSVPDADLASNYPSPTPPVAAPASVQPLPFNGANFQSSASKAPLITMSSFPRPLSPSTSFREPSSPPNHAIEFPNSSAGFGLQRQNSCPNPERSSFLCYNRSENASSAGKYRARTRSPSDGADVRWYFCRTPLGLNEAAASIPAIEVVGKGEYFRFSVSDSAALEAAFLEREEQLVTGWWKEFAECSEGPSTRIPPGPLLGSDDLRLPDPGDNSRTKVADDSTKIRPKTFPASRSLQAEGAGEDESVGVIVKGGLYEVDLWRRRCSPVYWRGDYRRVLRGHWFARKGGLDWLPLREDIAEQLELAYDSQIWRRRSFQPSGLYAARVNLQGSTLGLHALFTGEDDSWEAFLCVDATRISFVLGLKASGVRLRRGFALPESLQPTQDEVRQGKEEEMDDYASQIPVRHVVFMVHGIGQRLEKANLVDDVGTFRRTVECLAEQHLTNHQRTSQRVLFIPCQWRRELKLGGEAAVEDITLEGVRGLRTMLSATVHDVLYYMSPVYCQDIIDSVSHSLNRLYRKFIKRNPNYDGKVSLYGHSLGSVLTYDILCHQDNLVASFPIQDMTPVHVEHDSVKSSSDSSKDVNGLVGDDLDSPSLVDNSDATSEGKIEKVKTCIEDEASPASEDSNDTCKEIDDPSPHILSEVEALKAEVNLLQEKLAALEEKQSTYKKHFLDSSSFSGLTEPRMNLSSNNIIGAQLETNFSSRKHYTPFVSYTKLDFQVDTFYAVGSPLGLFLALRNVRIGIGEGHKYWQDEGIEEEYPACRQMLNIFHPYDPVAYRVEPLVCKEFVEKRPIFVPYHKGGRRLHIGMQELGEDLSARSKAIVNSLSYVGNRVASAFSSNSSEKKDEDNLDVKEETYGAKVMERLTGKANGRIDHMLQDATFEHQYISALSSHTAYWQDLDTALFILKHLYRDIPEEPPVQVVEDSATSKTQEEDSSVVSSESIGSFKKLHENFDSIDDDVPFTFFSKEEIAAAMADEAKVGSHP